MDKQKVSHNKRYVSDHKITVCLDGLRWVTKQDYGPRGWSLCFAYRGSEQEVPYRTKEERDLMYDCIVAGLE